jgi:hypothetical protein
MKNWTTTRTEKDNNTLRRLKPGLNKQLEAVSPVVAVIIMVIIIVALTAFLYDNMKFMSPEIYFHVEEEVTTDVTVEINGGVTTTIPQVPMGKKAVWKDVLVRPDGTINYQGKDYDFLYYEGRFDYQWSNQGWLVEEQDGKLYLNGVETDEAGILAFLEEKMLESGLLENEAAFLLERIVELDMLDMDSPYMSIHYIPIEDVDEAIKLCTSFEFQQMRRHFAFYEHDGPVDMVEPVYEVVEDTGFVIHETAVNKFGNVPN